MQKSLPPIKTDVEREVACNGCGPTGKRQMGTCSFRALGKELAGSGQLANSLQRLFPPVTILHRTQAAGKSMDFDFPHLTGFCTGWWQMGKSLKCLINEISITFAGLAYLNLSALE